MSIADIWRGRHRPVIDEQEPRPWKLPPDLEQQLVDAINDDSDTQEPEPPKPTAQQLANAITRIERELVGARQIIANSEARVAELKAQLAKQLDAEIAELELLRPKESTHANADADAGDTGPNHNAGSGAALREPESSTGEASGPARQV